MKNKDIIEKFDEFVTRYGTDASEWWHTTKLHKSRTIQALLTKPLADQKKESIKITNRFLDEHKEYLLKQVEKIIKEDYIGYANGEKFVYQSDVLRKINKLK